MKKFDTFQALTRGEKSLVAILLVVLISLGGVFAKTTYSRITAAKAELAQALPTPTNVSEPSVSTYYPEEDTTVVEPATVPYFVDFDENVDTNLVITNGENVNKWYIGQAQGFNNNKLYISSTNGLTNKYNTNSASEVTVSRDIMIPAAGAVVNFDYRVNGEIQADYVKVAVGSMWVVLRPTEGWENYTLNVPGTMAGVQTLTITWINDRGNGEQFPAAIDNISITEVACAQVYNLNAAVDSTTATITWNAPESQNDWTLEYRLSNHTEWYSVSATTPSVVLNNLQGNSTYEFRVKANCGEESSVWTYGTFAIDCQDLSENELDVTIGDPSSTSTNSYLPTYSLYNYSLTQQIYTAQELQGLAEISSVTFISTGSAKTRNIDIYLIETNKSAFASTSDWVPVTSANKVYSGNVTFPARGNVTVNFNTPFSCSGNSNLILTIADNTGSWSSGLNCRVSNATDYRGIYAYNDDTNYNPATPGSYSGSLVTNYNNVVFHGIVRVCEDPISCPDLAGLEVDDITYNSATIEWTLAEGSTQNNFVVEYKLENSSEWTVVPVQDATTLALSNLNQLSNYNVRIKAICGENDYSNYATADFSTLGVCASVTDIIASNSANSTTLTWLAGGEEAAWTVEFRPVGTENWVSLHVGIIPMTTLGGLVGNTPYEVRIKALCDAQDEANQSAWTYFYFTSGCAAVDVPYAQVFGSYTEPACWSNQDFEFEYPSYAATNDIDAWLMSPAINIPAEGANYVSFQVVPTGNYKLMASYRGTAMARFEEIYAGTGADGEVIVEIPEIYKGRMVNFMFLNGVDNWFKVYNMKVNSCPFVPRQLAASNLTGTSADLTWQGDARVSSWTLEYSVEGGEWTSMEVSTNPYTLTGLETSTTYQVRVKAACSDTYSNTVSFMTPCSAVALPFFEGFEAYTTGQASPAPNCWNLLNRVTSGSYPQAFVNNAAAYVKSGSQSLYFKSSNTTPVYAIMPQFTTDIENLILSFWYRNEGTSAYNGTIILGLMTDPSDASTFVELQTLTRVTTMTKVEYDFSTSIYTGSNYNIAFKYQGGTNSNYYASIDDINVVRISTCGVPSIAVNDGVATITRSSMGGDPDSYDLQIEDEIVTGVQSPANITELFPNLQANTEYGISVRANCGEGDYSDWSAPVSFTTPCMAIHVPYSEGFEDYPGTTYSANGVVPDCWNNYSTGSVAPHVISADGSYAYIHSGTKALTFYGSGSCYATLPEFSETLSSLQISFWMRTESASYGTLTLGYITSSDNNMNTFTEIQSFSNTTSGAIREVALQNVPANAYKLVFKWYYSSQYSICIDDILVEVAPSCGVPTITVSNGIATITQSSLGTLVSYDLQIGEEVVTGVQSPADLMLLFPSLQNNTEYEVAVRTNCGEGDYSDWSNPVSFTTPCAAISLPYTENFDGVTTTTAIATTVMPDCWSKLFTGTSTAYGVNNHNNSSSAHSGTNSLRFYLYASTYNPQQYGDGYAILPEFNAPINTTMISFYARKYSESNPANIEIGVVTDINDVVGTFTRITTVSPTSATYELFNVLLSDYAGTEGHLALRVVKPSSSYAGAYVDDLTVETIPTCATPSISVDGTVATITRSTIAGNPESYDLHIDGFQDQTVTENTVDLATIFTGLASGTTYQVTVRANCGGGDYSNWSFPVSFTTACGVISLPYTENFDNYTSSTTFSSSVMPNCWERFYTGTSTSYGASIYPSSAYSQSGNNSLQLYTYGGTAATYGDIYAILPAFDTPIAQTMISLSARKYYSSYNADFEIGVVTDLNNIAETFVTVGTISPSTTTYQIYSLYLSTYTGAEGHIAFRKVKPSSGAVYTFIDDVTVEVIPTCFAPEDLSVTHTDNSAVITWADSHSHGNYVVEYKEATAETWNNAATTEMTYTITGLIPSTDYDVRVKADCGEGDESEYATIDFSTYCLGYYFVDDELVCPNPTDLTISGIRTPLTACEVNDPVTILVKNTGIVYPIAGFTAHYILNEGDTVTEPVTLATELEPGQEMAYSFNTLPTYEPGNNMVYAWIELEGFELEYNDIYDYPYVVTPNTVPYVMNTVPEENIMGWNAFDENNDDITMNLRNRVISYTYNDMMAANDWMISPCFNLTAGTYNIIFDYQANSSLSEQFALYFGQGPTPEDMTQLLSQFVTVDEEAHSVMVPVTVAEDGTYNFGFYTNTSAGNMGFKIRNIEVLPVLNVAVTTDGNGTANPSGVIPVNYGENLTLMVTPNEMYHLGGIYLDGVKVVNEDPSGAGFMLYTLENVTADHNVYVEFKLEFRIIKSVENENAAYTDVPGYFIPAATDTVIDPSPFTVNFRPAQYYHFTTLELGILSLDEPIDVTDAVVANEDGSYSYTIDTLVISHYYLNALFDRDKVNINYNVLTGKGYANDSEVLAAPESYTTVVDHSVNGDIDTTVTIAPYTTGDAHSDYHIIDVTVDGQSQGIIDNYTFTDVIADHTIDIKYGFHVNATVRNYEPFNLGSTEIRGTIEPALQLVAEGDATTVSGTVQEHFHLYNLFVDGVDMMNDVTVIANPEGGYSYTYTIDSTIANYNIEAVVKLDTVGIHYHVVAGQGYADNSPLLNEGDNYTTHISFADSILTNVMPAPGYSISSYELEGFDMGAINNYQFNAVMREYFINLTFVPNDIEIVTNAYGHGAVSEGMNFTYNPETPVNYNFIATPEVGYHIVSVTINGEAEPVVDPASFTYTINNVSQDYVFDVIFALNTYTISAAATENGTITPMGTQSVNYGQSVVYTAAANEGAYIAEVTVDGQTTSFTQADNVVSYVIPFNAISANHTVSVVFSVKEFNVQASVDAASLGHGTVEGANTYSTTVNYGQNAGIHIVPATNYHVSALVVNGNEVPATQYYEFVNVQANHNLIASFAIDQYEMTAISNTPACTITPAQTTVNAGSNVTYTLTVAPGYHLVNVLDNGNEVTVSNNSFTVYNVTENHVINANFAPNNVTVTVNQPAHATINPGTQVVAYGATPSYVIVPQTGYQVVSVTAGNAVVDVTYSNGVGSFTLAPVYQDITVTANVVPQSYTITVSKEGQGTVTPGVDQTVTYGSNKTFNIAPAPHYVISDVLVDGVSKGAITSYTFVNVTANHTIKAIFEGNCEVPVDLQASQITSNSAVLTWSNTGAVSYIVTYKAYNEAAAHEATTTTNSYTATGLNADAIYSWSVKAVCAASLQSVTSETAYFQTTPASACAAPQNLTVLAESNESAAVSWTSDASAFNLRYKRQGDPESTYAYVYNYTETSYTFLFLLSNTAYDWGVQAVCNAVTGNVSEWSNGTFTTTTTGIASADLSSIKVYSHLNNVYIVNEEGINISEVNIFDIYGKKIYEGNVNNNPEVISLDVANGNYIVRLNTENGVAVYKLAIIR